ncbi:Peptidoglycan recognition protein 3 [Araneus ventricosus]|uniref:Peptidoglycan recognition protein 3 n=1 Tax=Araneus ventricosus TaxID=182803 RepID=A0A4Y2GYN0_ARAVE|nr:Peptidoglycan recognition protein 3 [Araneus ventricosus]
MKTVHEVRFRDTVLYRMQRRPEAAENFFVAREVTAERFLEGGAEGTVLGCSCLDVANCGKNLTDSDSIFSVWKELLNNFDELVRELNGSSAFIPNISYSFLVGGDGRIYEGRGWKTVGAHTYGCNSKAIGISFMGNFDKVQPSAAMIDAAMKLIDCGVEKKFILATLQIRGHRDAKCTACPREALYSIIQKCPAFKGGKLPGYVC